jgi:uncharacterized protein (TIGR03118 family)
MHRYLSALAVVLVACTDTSNPNLSSQEFTVSTLVADTAGFGAAAVDTNLKNPWGLAFGPTGTLWVSDNHSGKSTLYDTAGTIRTLVVPIPAPAAAAGGAPSGIVFNPTTSFVIPASTKALFIFAGEDGVISAWNSSTPSAVRVADRSADTAVYKGLALASSGGANFLFATNFKQAKVDVFDSAFAYVKSFTDTTIPAGFAPFGIQAIGGQLYVTFAKQLGPDNEDDQPGSGNGYVDVFDPAGTLVRRFASQGSLDSPWGVALSPTPFGGFSHFILVGNFGDGRINAFHESSGAFGGTLLDLTGKPIAIEGLWGLAFSPIADSTTLFFSAGPGGEADGVIGTIKAK